MIRRNICLQCALAACVVAQADPPPADAIPGFLAQIDAARLRRGVFHLAKDPLPYRKVTFTAPGHARHSLDETDAWIQAHLSEWGYAVEREACDVRAFACNPKKPKHHTYDRPPINAPSFTAYNIFAKKIGRRRPGEIILLLAHKDSQSWTDSPGAYDNAVGTVAVLEIARVLAAHASERSIWFLWCNEEHTPWTSIAAAEGCRARGDNLVAIFNVDSIGGKSDEDIAAGRKTNTTLYTTPEGRTLADLMAEVNESYGIGLIQSSWQRERPGDDDGSFVMAGFARAVANIGSFPYADAEYHLAGDTAERVDIANVKMATQATLAAVLRLDRAP